ncbi:hypothetical protein ATEIFO6365_0012021000 [Aspergillus terreus]|uniref:Alpha/beta hydrolase fold-3 domain-containing protein n=1 Tax=Aspergillus terreus TaxID=33178 RepID=A0A5M3ZC57_ASPTE|nr:hypothetical protein ATETN484_0013022000 [Aspergillus terreus]GFF20454.1 hypothetical protein ATEIFO6365_0012021000 [Aspergillus terreus]
MAASPRRCRPLAQEYVEKVLPNMNVTASSADSGFKFSREDINKQMDKMKEAKDKSLAEYWPHLGQKVRTEDFDIPMRDGEKVLIRVYTPNESPIESGKRPVVYSLHGGGFVTGNVDSEDLINRQLCHETHSLIFSLNYRLAPENPIFPTGVNDTEDGLKWVHENASRGLWATFLILAFQANKLNIPVPGMILRQGVFIFCPLEELVDWRPEVAQFKSREENVDAPGLPKHVVDALNQLLAVTATKHKDVEDFPIFASLGELSRMPPTHFVQATADPCADDITYFKRRLTEAGVETTLATYEGMPHGFHAYHVLSAARQEMKDTADALKRLIARFNSRDST